jgi:hypothetical protein
MRVQNRQPQVHDEGYVRAFLDGSIDPALMRRIGLPWSPTLVRRTLVGAGSAVLAARLALQLGVAVMCNGGTHHAHRDYGAGAQRSRLAAMINDLLTGLALLRCQRISNPRAMYPVALCSLAASRQLPPSQRSATRAVSAPSLSICRLVHLQRPGGFQVGWVACGGVGLAARPLQPPALTTAAEGNRHLCPRHPPAQTPVPLPRRLQRVPPSGTRAWSAACLSTWMSTKGTAPPQYSRAVSPGNAQCGAVLCCMLGASSAQLGSAATACEFCPRVRRRVCCHNMQLSLARNRSICLHLLYAL